MDLEKIRLRLFSAQKGDGALIAEWITDPDYITFFRNNSVLPTFEECCAYPAWSQNLVMMVDYEGQTIGMVNGYHANYRNSTVHAGAILDKRFHGLGLGHTAQVAWINCLFQRHRFRKVIVDNIHEHFTEPYLKIGFFEEGRHKAEAWVNGEWRDEIRMACFVDGFKPHGEKEVA